MKRSLTDWSRQTPILAPARALRRRLLDARHARDTRIVTRVQALLAEDPVVHVAEFRGDFQLDARSHLFRRVLLNDGYEPEISGLCSLYAPPDRDAIDVGANAGFFSVLLARLSDTRRVLAVEPSSMMLPRLCGNLIRNGVQDRVTVVECALSNANGKAQLQGVKGMEEYGTIGRLAHPSMRGIASKAQTETVETSTLDALVNAHGLDPGFVKVDVEGAEALVFQGASVTLDRHRPIVLSELDDALLRANGASALDVLRVFHAAGYRTLDPHQAGRPDVDLRATDRLTEILCVPEESVSG